MRTSVSPGAAPRERETNGAAPIPSGVAHAKAGDTGGPARPRLRLRCLGGFALTIDGRPIDEAAAKPMERALLHVLAMRPGEQVHREALIEALWPEADPDAGLHRLQVAISALRRLTDGRVWLPATGCWFGRAIPTVWRFRTTPTATCGNFEAQLRRAAAARSSGDPLGEEAALDAALRLYAGPLLPGDGPADWVVGRRAALQGQAADAAVRLAAFVSSGASTGRPSKRLGRAWDSIATATSCGSC